MFQIYSQISLCLPKEEGSQLHPFDVKSLIWFNQKTINEVEIDFILVNSFVLVHYLYHQYQGRLLNNFTKCNHQLSSVLLLQLKPKKTKKDLLKMVFGIHVLLFKAHWSLGFIIQLLKLPKHYAPQLNYPLDLTFWCIIYYQYTIFFLEIDLRNIFSTWLASR